MTLQYNDLMIQDYTIEGQPIGRVVWADEEIQNSCFNCNAKLNNSICRYCDTCRRELFPPRPILKKKMR